jgi:hypothetical protein
MPVCDYCRPIFMQRSSVIWGTKSTLKVVNTLRPLRDLCKGEWNCCLCQTFKQDLKWLHDKDLNELDGFELVFDRGLDSGIYGSWNSIDVLKVSVVPRENYFSSYVADRVYYRMFAEIGKFPRYLTL